MCGDPPQKDTQKRASITALAAFGVFIAYTSVRQIWLSGVSLKEPSKMQFRRDDLMSIGPQKLRQSQNLGAISPIVPTI